MYGFQGIPDTVLIGADGKIAGIAHPVVVKASNIGELPDGKPVKLPVPQDLSIKRAEEDNPTPPLLDIMVRHSATGAGGSRMGPNILQAKGSTIRLLLANATHVPLEFVEGADDVTRYDVSLEAPGANSDAFQKLVPDALCLAFHVTMKRETRDTEGWILKAPNGKPEALKEASTHGGSGQSGHGAISMTGMSMESFAGMVRGVLRKPVLDQTGIPGRFDLKLKYDDNHPESVLEELRGMGFVVEKGVVPTEFLVVSKGCAT